MKHFRKTPIVCCLIILFAFSMIIVSCSRKPEPLEQKTHREVEDLERYVYDNGGDEIIFGEPTIDEEAKTAELVVIRDIGKPIDVYDTARCLINDYLEDNPDYHLSADYRIRLSYYERNANTHADSDYYYIANSANYLVFSGYSSKGTEEGTIDFNSISVISCDPISYSYKTVCTLWQVNAINVRGNGLTHDEIIDLVRSLPMLEYIYISYWDGDIDELIDDINIYNPDVELLWVHN